MSSGFITNSYDSARLQQIQAYNTQAIDIIFQVWEHAQKSKIFLPNKACFLILLRIVFNFLNKKIALFMLYFCISSIKTNQMWKKVHFFTDQWQLVKSSRKFSAILEFFLGPTFLRSRTFLCPELLTRLKKQREWRIHNITIKIYNVPILKMWSWPLYQHPFLWCWKSCHHASLVAHTGVQSGTCKYCIGSPIMHGWIEIIISTSLLAHNLGSEKNTT